MSGKRTSTKLKIGRLPTKGLAPEDLSELNTLMLETADFFCQYKFSNKYKPKTKSDAERLFKRHAKALGKSYVIRKYGLAPYSKPSYDGFNVVFNCNPREGYEWDGIVILWDDGQTPEEIQRLWPYGEVEVTSLYD